MILSQGLLTDLQRLDVGAELENDYPDRLDRIVAAKEVHDELLQLIGKVTRYRAKVMRELVADGVPKRQIAQHIGIKSFGITRAIQKMEEREAADEERRRHRSAALSDAPVTEAS